MIGLIMIIFFKLIIKFNFLLAYVEIKNKN